jgi:hypothetical protein
MNRLEILPTAHIEPQECLSVHYCSMVRATNLINKLNNIRQLSASRLLGEHNQDQTVMIRRLSASRLIGEHHQDQTLTIRQDDSIANPSHDALAYRFDALAYRMKQSNILPIQMSKLSIDENMSVWESNETISIPKCTTSYSVSRSSVPRYGTHVQVTLSHRTQFKYVEVWAQLSSKHETFPPTELSFTNEPIFLTIEATPDIPDVCWKLKLRTRGAEPDEMFSNDFIIESTACILAISSSCESNLEKSWKRKGNVLYTTYDNRIPLDGREVVESIPLNSRHVLIDNEYHDD